MPDERDVPRWLTNEAIIRGLIGLVMILLTMGLGHLWQRITLAEETAASARRDASKLSTDVESIKKDVESTKRHIEGLTGGVRTIENWVLEQKAREDERNRARGGAGRDQR